MILIAGTVRCRMTNARTPILANTVTFCLFEDVKELTSKLIIHKHRIIHYVLAIILVAVAFPGIADESGARFNALRVAHAGGGLGRMTYTNSYQALEANYAKGFRYFELDFVFTSDGHLVCLHDWKANFTRTFGFETDRSLSLEVFEELVNNNDKFTNCTLPGLAEWMVQYRDAIIVTDVRGNNLEALKRIANTLPAARTRVIPQIYNPLEFSSVKDLGFQQIIWTLYRYRGRIYQVLDWVTRWGSAVAVAMPKQWASTALPRELNNRDVPTYVHTINKPEELKKLTTELGITEIYTDFLGPERY